MSRIEGQLRKLYDQIAKVHVTMADAATGHVRVGELNVELSELEGRKEALEEEWLTLVGG